jgi:hypothetical protein
VRIAAKMNAITFGSAGVAEERGKKFSEELKLQRSPVGSVCPLHKNHD